MQKEEILQLLKEKNISYEMQEHPAIFTVEEGQALHMKNGDVVAKNLFLRDDKKRNYYLLTVKEEKHIDLRQFQEEQHTRRLSFASENDLMSMLGLIKGSVTPFGLLNDTEHKVVFFLDEDFQDSLIGIHPNENTATVFLNADDLMRILSECGCQCSYVTIHA